MKAIEAMEAMEPMEQVESMERAMGSPMPPSSEPRFSPGGESHFAAVKVGQDQCQF